MPAAPISSTSSSPADCSPAPVPLSELEPGATAVIDQVLAGAATRRLEDLGLLPRTQIQVLRRAPLGDPVEYELRGYRLCLRRSEAARIRVQQLTGRPASAR
jgi:ferrous iron transport protein A